MALHKINYKMIFQNLCIDTFGCICFKITIVEMQCWSKRILGMKNLKV